VVSGAETRNDPGADRPPVSFPKIRSFTLLTHPRGHIFRARTHLLKFFIYNELCYFNGMRSLDAESAITPGRIDSLGWLVDRITSE